MDTRRIGSLEVSVVGVGCNNFGGRIDEAQTAAVVAGALEAGITFFDTADIYGNALSEVYLGKALGAHRDEVVVATKFGVPYEGKTGGASAGYLKEAVDASLARLGTDRIDLYQLHVPDAKTPIAETLGALGELVAAGKVREIGCSNFTAAQLQEANEAAESGPRFVSVQNQYSVLERDAETEVLPAAERLGLAFLPYFPLANGLLTGKYRTGQPAPEGTRIAAFPAERSAQLLSEENLEKVAALEVLSAKSGHSILDLAISWLLTRQPVASVISGATKAAQAAANATAARWAIPDDVLESIDEVAPIHIS